MAEENKEVLEEVTDEQNEQQVEEVVEEVNDESMFDSADNPDVIKIDLDKTPEVKSEEVEQQPADEENVVVVNEEPKEEIVNLIKQSLAEKKLSNIDEINVDVDAKDVSEQIKLQK